MIKNIEKCKLFAGIAYGDILNLMESVHYRVMKYQKNQLLAYQSTPCNELIILIEGTVVTEMTKLSGNSVKIADLHAPDCLAVAFIFGDDQFFPVDVTASTEVTAVKIPKSSVLKMFATNQQFLANFLDMVSSRAQYLTEKMKFFSFQTIKGKIAYFLLKTAGEKQSDSFTIKQTQIELADLFGVARPSLARSLKNLSDEGLISVNRKEITILNKKELASFMQYENRIH